MSDEEKPSTDDLENLPDPDTDTGDKFPAMEAIPVAEPSAPEPPPASAATAEGPRIFPQQYKMLFANTCILVGTLTVWERQHVTGQPNLYGFQSIGGAFVLAAAAYCILVGVVGLIRGGMRLGSSLLSSFFALYFAIASMLRVKDIEGFQLFGDLQDKFGFQKAVNTWVSQFGPGIYLNLLGGAVILWMFIKAMFFSKKKAPEPAPRRRR
ncbi:MAG TPA: hypothetical protein VFY93_10830 [Planctomycetota bacterium]|nr:hypothetical protein [Planctomycetota bacterium]